MDVAVDQAKSDESQLVWRLPRRERLMVRSGKGEAAVMGGSRRGAAHCQGIGRRWGEIGGGCGAIPTSGRPAIG
jgi:hypothetical protein